MGYNKDASREQAEKNAAKFAEDNPNTSVFEQAIKEVKSGAHKIGAEKVKEPKG